MTRASESTGNSNSFADLRRLLSMAELWFSVFFWTLTKSNQRVSAEPAHLWITWLSRLLPSQCPDLLHLNIAYSLEAMSARNKKSLQNLQQTHDRIMGAFKNLQFTFMPLTLTTLRPPCQDQTQPQWHWYSKSAITSPESPSGRFSGRELFRTAPEVEQ